MWERSCEEELEKVIGKKSWKLESERMSRKELERRGVWEKENKNNKERREERKERTTNNKNKETNKEEK